MTDHAPGEGPAGADQEVERDRTWSVYLLAAAVSAVALGITLLESRSPDAIVDLGVPMIVIAIGFALAERFPIHLELRSEAHSFSLSTIPLVIGLFTLEPAWLVAARLLGSGLVLILHRRQVLLKLLMNLSSFWLEVAVAVLVFRWLVPAGNPVSGAGWFAALAAGVASDVVQVVVISTAIALFTGKFDIREAVPTLFATFGALVDTCLALVAVALMVSAPEALPLLAVIPVVLWLSYGAYSHLHEKHRSLEEVYGFTRTLSSAGNRGTVVETLLGQVQELLHADSSWLYVESDDGGRRWTLDAAGHAAVEQLAADSPERAVHGMAQHRPPSLVSAGDTADQMAILVRALGHRQALVARLQGAAGTLATLVVADRSGEVREFVDDDRRLFEALAHQAGVALDNAELIHRLRSEAATNEYQSLHDALTDLPNRAYFDRALNEALGGKGAVAVLLLDLDRFKEVNDTLGHHNGDLLLQEVGVRLRAVLRRNDTVARLGGDEFAVLVSDLVTPDAAVHVAAAVRAVLERPIRLGEVEVSVGASIGIAVAPQHGTTAELVMQRADVAMYQAKDSGSGVALYDPERDEYSPARLALVGELRAAVVERQIDVHYQPLIELETGAVVGVEALARWSHPKRGPVPPDEFVKIAENTGLINALTDVVLTQAIDQCAEWRRAGHDIRVSVNLSVRNLLDPWLIDLVRSRLAAADLPGSALCLEITESCAMGDPTRTWALLTRLGDLGIAVAIDDFGTGYSSLAYLKRLPVHEVKIDRAFVSALGTASHDPADYAIVRAVTELARSMGLEVVAEGIELEESIQSLRDAGCHLGQGYFFSRPLPAAQLTEWLGERRTRLAADAAELADPGSEPVAVSASTDDADVILFSRRSS